MLIGGGYTRANNDIIVERNNTDCFDEFNWADTSEQITCSSFYSSDRDESVHKCLATGNFTSIHGTKASDACCYCRYGYDVVGGGYRGILRDKMFRVSATSYQDIGYFHGINLQYLFGAMIDFVKLVAENHGFGMIQYINLKELNATGQLSSDSYDACLNGA